MSLSYKCPECETEMALTEESHVCQNEDCGKSLTIKEATTAFEAGELIGLVEESEVKDLDEEKTAIVADISEDISALTEGEDLSEEFVEKAKTIMEAAVLARVEEARKSLDEAHAVALEEAKQSLVEKIDGYLDYVVAEWVKENEIAIESGIKADMNESFVDGLASLLQEHYVKAPEERWDIVEGLAAKVEGLEGKLDEAVAANIEAKGTALVAEKKLAFAGLAEGLAETQKEKLASLAEGVEANSVSEYVEKVETLKESYFKAKTEEKDGVSEDVKEDEPTVNNGLAEALRLLKSNS